MRYLHFAYVVIAVLLLGAGLFKVNDWERSLGLGPTKSRLEMTEKQLSTISDLLHVYRVRTGRYPTNDEGLLAVPELVALVDSSSEVRSWHYGWRMDDAGILCPWGEPYIYENGTHKSGNHMWSVRVNDDVRVWSLAAEKAYNHYSTWLPWPERVRTALVLAAILFFAAFIRGAVRAGASSPAGKLPRTALHLLGGIGLGALTALLLPLLLGFTTCYVTNYGNRPRTPELTREYMALMTQYHERGIIGDSAFKKIESAMKKSSGED
jgi:hypothetical protein